MRGLFLELLCWLKCHPTERDTKVVGWPRKWVTTWKCDCGLIDEEIEGIYDAE